MLDFTATSFAFAGLAAAAGPVIIHWLNRRRFRRVDWAAMDFLREAVQRHRRRLQLRDLVLLVLRVLALVFLGLALARPYLHGSHWGGSAAAVTLALFVLTGGCAAAAVLASAQWRRFLAGLSGVSLMSLLALLVWSRQDRSEEDTQPSTSRMPVHAVLVIDNSRSMGVESVAGTLLDRAKARVLRFLDELPPESRITLIPLAGSVEPFPQDAFRSKDEARRALERISLMDVAGDVTAALEEARDACASIPELPTLRVCILTDLQASAWSNVDWARWSRELPGMQVAPLSMGDARNVWISRFELEDGIAGTEAPARLLAHIQAAGLPTATTVQASLLIDGTEVDNQVVELAPGQSRELEFFHQFDVPGSPGGSVAVLQLHTESLAADQLPADNRAVLWVPVVSALPIVFVDQWGDQENVAQGRIGETYALRHLLAPRLANEVAPRRLIQAFHVRPEEVSQSLLESARLVIVAGVESPGDMVPGLRDYVVQGGPLMILAGGGFDPVAWQELAWKDGAGILAAPLLPQPMGTLPQEAAVPQPFFADFQSLQHDDFVITGEDPATLAAIFNVTPFFKAVQADVSSETTERWKRTAITRVDADLTFLRTWDEARQQGGASHSGASSADRAHEDRWRRLEPNWWLWRSPLPLWDRSASAEDLVNREQPRVLAWFQGGHTPWVVERLIGAGTVVFWSSGVTSDWNLLRSSPAMYVFHRTCHRLLEGTLPRRNFQAGDRIALPLAVSDEDRYFVERPDGDRENLPVEALAPNVSGLIVRQPLRAGLYSIRSETTAEPLGNNAGGSLPSPSAETTASTVLQLAVQAPVSESVLEVVSPARLAAKPDVSHIRFLTIDEPLHLEGGTRRGQSLWKWCAGAMLTLLFIEMAVIAASMSRRPA